MTKTEKKILNKQETINNRYINDNGLNWKDKNVICGTLRTNAYEYETV